MADTAYIRRFIRDQLELRASSDASSSPNRGLQPAVSDESSVRRVGLSRAVYERCWSDCGGPGLRHVSRLHPSEYYETLAQFLERCDLVPRLTQGWPRFADNT